MHASPTLIFLISKKNAYHIFNYFIISFVFTAFIGLLYPCVDSRLGEKQYYKREWSHVMRCLAVFVGINHASAVSFCVFVDIRAIFNGVANIRQVLGKKIMIF